MIYYTNKIRCKKVVSASIKVLTTGLFLVCCHHRITSEELSGIHLSQIQIVPLPNPLCLWRVVQAERASSSWAALMANLKNFHSTTESCIAILNYR